MKRLFIPLILLFVCSGIAFAVKYSYKNNTYQKLAEEYSVKADKALDAGEYILAEDYARQAAENAALSEEFVRNMLRREAAEEILSRAKKRLEYAKSIDAESYYPEEYAQAVEYYNKAKSSLEKEEIDLSMEFSQKVLDALANIKNKKPGDKKTDKKSDGKNGSSSSSSSNLADEKAGGNAASEKNRLRYEDAKSMLSRAKERLDYAKTIKADKNYPVAFSAAEDYYRQAKSAFDKENYDSSISLAQKVLDTLAGIKGINPLPRFYIVQPWELTRDCLWNISGRTYVYNNPWLWENLYEANKKILPEPDNPNLILPGMKLEIPSISGEYRSGTYDPDLTYDTFNPLNITR